MRDIQLGLHLRQREPVDLEFPDRLAEGVAVGGVFAGHLERAVSVGNRVHGDAKPLGGQVAHQVVEAPALFTEQVRGRYPDVAEEQLRGVLGAVTDLVELAAPLEALEAFLDYEQAHAPVPGLRICPRDDDNEVGENAVADEGLRPVEHVVIAVAAGGGLDLLEVRPRPGFGHGYRDQPLAGHEARQPPVALLFVSQVGQVGRHHVVMQREGDALGPGRGDLLSDDDAVTEVADAQAAVLLGDHPAEQPDFAGLAPGLPADDARRQPFRRVRDAFLRQEGPHGLAELLMLFGEDGPAHGCLLWPGSRLARRCDRDFRHSLAGA